MNHDHSGMKCLLAGIVRALIMPIETHLPQTGWRKVQLYLFQTIRPNDLFSFLSTINFVCALWKMKQYGLCFSNYNLNKWNVCDEIRIRALTHIYVDGKLAAAAKQSLTNVHMN